MFQFEKYDFSKETKIKDELFDKMKTIYEKAKMEGMELSDEDLDIIAAAAGRKEKKSCPFPQEECVKCENYNKNQFGKAACKIGCEKNR